MLDQLLQTGTYETLLYRVELLKGKVYKVYNRKDEVVFEKTATGISYWELVQFLGE